MTTQQEFKNQKEQGKAVLEKLQGFLEQGRDFELFGISVDDSLEKLQKAKDKINQSEFKKLSHIDSLQNATTEIIKQNGGLESITIEAQNSIISDIVSKQLPQAIKLQNKIKGDMQRLDESIKALRKDMERTNDRINDAQMALRDFVARYFNDLIRQVNGTSLETFEDFMQGKIGSEGSLMSARVQNEFQRHAHSVINELKTSIERFDKEKDDFEKAVISYGKQGVVWLQKSGVINNKNVLLVRDFLKTGLEKIGVNVGKALNFKPWGAIKFAKGATAVVAVFGLALEVWDSYRQYEKEQEFKKAKAKIVEMLENQMNEILSTIKDNEKFYTLFNGYEPLKNALEDTRKDLQMLESTSAEFEKWIEQGEIIEAEIIK